MTGPQLTIRRIAVIVAEDFGSSLALMRGQGRKSENVTPRQVAMYLAHHHIGQSLPDIGRWFGNRDHTTVLHAIRSVAAKAEHDDALRDRLQCLGERINEAEGAILARTWVPPEPKCEALPPVTVVTPPPPASDEPGARRVIDAVRGYVESRRALSDAAFTKGEVGARRRVETEYAMLERAWGDYAARRGRS